MRFILALTTGEKFIITEEEAKGIMATSENNSVAIKRIGVMVQKRMCLIYPEHSSDRIEDKKKQQTGVLHDGTFVRRNFGQWVLANHACPDDDGNYQPVKLDLSYYPEVAVDMVADEKEWKFIKENKKNYYEVLGIQEKRERIGNKDFTPLFENYDNLSTPKQISSNS